MTPQPADWHADRTAFVLTVTCPGCNAPIGQRCRTRLARGYHIIRADMAIRREQREETN